MRVLPLIFIALLGIVGVALFTTSCVNEGDDLFPESPDKLVVKAERIDPRELVVDLDGSKGRNVVLSGEVNEVIYDSSERTTWVHLLADVPGDRYGWEPVAVRYKGKVKNLARHRRVTVYAVVEGSEEVQNQLTGVNAVVPSLRAYKILVE